MFRNLAFALVILQTEAFLSPNRSRQVVLLTKPRETVSLFSSIASINDQKLEVSPPSTFSKTSDTEKSLNIRINGEWYDLTKWRQSHPAGEHWIDLYNKRDATEVMDAFHSEKAKMMYQRLQKVDETKASELEKNTPKDTEVTLAFREFRTKLERDGWFKRDLVHEAKLIGINLSLLIGAAVSAHSIPLLSILLLSLGYVCSGWIGHDVIHSTDQEYGERLRPYSSLVGGLGSIWWSDKHNLHHAHTNEMGVDGDMAVGPLLFTYVPDPKNDTPWRKVQHYTFVPVFSLLRWLWAVRSFQEAIKGIENKRPNAKKELYCLMAHYGILLTVFPMSVWIPAFFLSGLITALIVTPTHQNDTFFSDTQNDWVTSQFESTRNAVLTNPFSTWLWGGMQYQLEHHLFPAMPRSKYPALRPILKQFASENNLKYLESGEFEILKMNWELMRDVAKADPVVGAPQGALFTVNDKLATGAKI